MKIHYCDLPRGHNGDCARYNSGDGSGKACPPSECGHGIIDGQVFDNAVREPEAIQRRIRAGKVLS